MKKSQILMSLSALSFVSILFTPAGTGYWVYPLILGLVFGLIWFLKKD